MLRLERRLRLATGLVIATYVVLHFANHALGIGSVEAMDRMRRVVAAWWRSPPGTVLLYGSLAAHFFLALVSLYRRTTLRMPAWEACQLAFGLAVPPLLVAHVVGTRIAYEVLGHQIDYVRVLGVLWSDPWLAARQSLLVVLVWTHLCIGLHYWLRLGPWYPRMQPVLFVLAALVPALALAGFAAAGLALRPQIELMGGPRKFFADLATMTEAERQALANWSESLLWIYWLALAATLAARLQRVRAAEYRIHHSSGAVLTAPLGRSILEAVRDAGLPHASICGGRARCTTCRVRVGQGLDRLPPPSALEAEALGRIEAPPNVRLACQTRPRGDVWVTPLLPGSSDPALARRAGGVQGRERRIAAMFVDLRDSTALAETRLPYDVVFLLNQFFAEMFEALKATGGYYAQFRGDGLLALYGLRGEFGAACRQALAGAAEMQRRIDRLNQVLAAELAAPLGIGIGLHAGVAIVGTMGPPDAPIYSAIGDTVNIAARLEGMSKYYRCTLVVSAETVRQAGFGGLGAPLHRVRVRGRAERLDVYAVQDPRALQALPAT